MARIKLLLLLAIMGCSSPPALEPPPPPPALKSEEDGAVQGDPDSEPNVASLRPGDGDRPHYQVRVGDVLLDVLQDETTDNERILVVYLDRELTKAELEDATKALRGTALYRWLRMFVSYFLPGEIGREAWASAAFAPDLTIAIGEELGIAPRPGSPIVWRRYDPDEDEERIESPFNPSRPHGVRSYGPAPSRAFRSTGGPVHVRGYYRRDGTYVRPHTRRRPGSR